MTIKEFVQKYGEVYNVNYNSLHRLIRLGALKENIHYTLSHRVYKSKINLKEKKVKMFLETGE